MDSIWKCESRRKERQIYELMVEVEEKEKVEVNDWEKMKDEV